MSKSIVWQDLASCRGVVTVMQVDDESVVFDPFFDMYEQSEPPHIIRRAVDDMCISCPVRKQCEDFGVKNKQSGVWGGKYLQYGKVDPVRNEHKTKKVWEALQ